MLSYAMSCYNITDPKVAEEHIYTKFSNHDSFQVTSDFTHYGRR